MRTDVVIVGGGLAGSAAAWQLSRRGREVVLLEAFEPGHRRGSSHGSARIFRRAYPDPLYVRLTGVARRHWDELEDEAGEELIRVTGALDFGPSAYPRMMYELLTAQGVPAELLSSVQARERWPALAFDDAHPVMFHPEGGVIDADLATSAMQRLAARRGARISHGTPVTGIDTDGTVRTAGESFTASVVIVAVGAWLEPLLGAQLRLPRVEVAQMDAFHFAPKSAPESTNETWPTFIRYDDDPPMYGLLAGRDGEVPGAVKVGVHGLGTVTTADDRTGVVNQAVKERVRSFVMTYVPGLDPLPVGELTCLYTNTASEDFILDRRGRIVVLSPCSGHGAKFAPLTGEIAADLAEGKPPPHERFTIPAHQELPGTFPAQSASLLAGALPRP